MTHPNHELLERLFTALDRHDHETMAACYAPDAQFRDIAFDLSGRKQIHGMWHMICSGDIKAKFEVVSADEDSGVVKLVDTYTFGAAEHPPGRRVRNAITSRFVFRDRRIERQVDECDPKQWATAALGNGVMGFFAGRFRWMRSLKAQAKLAHFVTTHPEYA